MAVRPMSARELQAWIDGREQAVLLDVRTEKEVEDWKIHTNVLPLVNIPYAPDAEDEMKRAWSEQLSREQKIFVICRRGRTARIVAEQLDQLGYDIYVLDKGMQEWSQFYLPHLIAIEENMKLVQVMRPGKGCLSYMILSGTEAIVVDPGRHVEEYIALAAHESVEIRHVLDTHLHADHISGGRELAERTGARYYISATEMQDAALAYEALEQHPQIGMGGVEVKVLRLPTPGHTPGSVSFIVNDRYLLTGDTIFVGGIGRPDLGGKAAEWAQLLYDTVFGSLASFGDDLLVLPAHYADAKEINEHGYVGTTLGAFRSIQEAQGGANRETFTERIVSRIGATPPNYAEIVEINRGTVVADGDKCLELEVGPNRCAVKHFSG
jgi:glyoxylase-like metal-dependent hydrolase (beta-lactamase superfamily II)